MTTNSLGTARIVGAHQLQGDLDKDRDAIVGRGSFGRSGGGEEASQ